MGHAAAVIGSPYRRGTVGRELHAKTMPDFPVRWQQMVAGVLLAGSAEYDEDDVRVRPAARPSRTRIRPATRNAADGFVVAVDRGGTPATWPVRR